MKLKSTPHASNPLKGCALLLNEQEQAWVDQLQAGQISVMEQLIDTYGSRMKRTAFLMTGDEGVAEDCVQEMFISFYFNIRFFRADASIGTYLYRILMNACKQKLRNQWFHKVMPTDELQEYGEKSIEEDALRRMAIHKVLARLKPKYREVLVLYYFNQLTVDEIGLVMNENSNTIKTRMKRGREQLRPYLEREGFGNGIPENV